MVSVDPESPLQWDHRAIQWVSCCLWDTMLAASGWLFGELSSGFKRASQEDSWRSSGCCFLVAGLAATCFAQVFRAIDNVLAARHVGALERLRASVLTNLRVAP